MILAFSLVQETTGIVFRQCYENVLHITYKRPQDII